MHILCRRNGTFHKRTQFAARCWSASESRSLENRIALRLEGVDNREELFFICQFRELPCSSSPERKEPRESYNYRSAIATNLPRLQAPHAPPSLAQCLQYLQFLQALHGSLPVQVAKEASATTPIKSGSRRTGSRKRSFKHIVSSSGKLEEC